MKTALRSHSCGELRLTDAGTTVALCGWAQRVRDLGKFCFLDLRDRFGLTQIAFNTGRDAELYEQARKLGREFVVRVEGEVIERESKNPDMPTGEIEIKAAKLEILNPAKLPPFLIEDDTDGSEDLRMQYRYLDVRRPALARALILRARLIKAVRQYLDGLEFLEIETPNLIKSTPEGARDFIVPSRMHPGAFYALPQSPQILKQLLMVGGMDRYYQICKCYRDEDFRGDRQPEFTQIDCEMAFVDQEDILSTFEGMVKHVFKEVANVELPDFPRLTHAEALSRFGSDKPDLRFGAEIVALNETVRDTEFKVFRDAMDGGGLVAGICAKGCAGYSRKQLDKLTDFVKEPHRGCKGLVYIKCNEDGSFKSSVDKFFSQEQLKTVADAMKAETGDLLLVLADEKRRVQTTLGDLRLHLAKEEGWIDKSEWSVLYVVDFPLAERDPEDGQLYSSHHPFVMPREEDMQYLDDDPERVRTWCYDMVMNGNEIMSGSVRIHDRGIQERIFNMLGLSEEEKREKFGFMLDAFEYGAPPHGGCAFGVDRWAMLLAGGETIRDVIAFPKNSNGRDVMLDAPAPVDPEALKIVGVKIDTK